MHMHTLDWLVMLVPLAFVLVIAAKTYGHTKSVADFMAASRCAGRYLLANAAGEAAGGVIGQIAAFQVLFVAGFAMAWWGKLHTPVTLLIVLTGFVLYRYRETRVMTMQQFLEIRYSKGFRIFAGIMAVVAGVVNFGIFPATGARFFVYFCGFPQDLPLGGGYTIPTFVVLMAIFLCVGLFLTISGGQLTIMVVDCVEGLISGLFYLIVIAALLYLFSWRQISEALAAAPPGQSMLDPFDTRQTQDFNIWYVVLGIVAHIYGTGTWQGGSGFRAAAASPHEAKMGGILGHWRGYSKGLMFLLLGICAFTYLHHADFLAQAAPAHEYLQTIEKREGHAILTQMQAPVALAHLLPIGIKGVLASIMLFAMMAGDGAYMHSWGGILIQDVILPFRKKPFETRQHLWLLRLSIIGVALFAFFFGWLYPQTDYILFFFSLTGALISGAGAAILGGLYWKKGTTAGAWASMIVGCVLAISGMVVQNKTVWTQYLGPSLRGVFPDSAYLQANLMKFPINGQWIAFFAQVAAVSTYVIVSLLTCRQNFNMDRMLHRGPYGTADTHGVATAKRKFTWGSLIGFDREFTRGDKWISGSMFGWNMFWVGVFAIVSIWNVFYRWPLEWWSRYWHVCAIVMPLIVGVATTIWFTWGGIYDLRKMFKALRTVRRDARDDGMVVGHRNLDEIGRGEEAKSSQAMTVPEKGAEEDTATVK